MAAVTVTVSSLTDVANELQARNITQMDQANQVRFVLDEQAPLQHAFDMSVKTNPGRHGFILENPELMKCKVKAKSKLENSFNAMLDGSLNSIDEELERVEQSLVALRVLVRYNDNQIDQMGLGTPLVERNRGPQQCIYPEPPFPEDPSFEHGTTLAHRVPCQHAYGTQQQRNEAAARDRRAQRALWAAKLRIEEVRQSLLKDIKCQMMSKMREELKHILEERSDLGVGYANYQLPPLA